MTAAGAKAAYGRAPTKKCQKCDRKISRTSISKHVKVCKGIKLLRRAAKFLLEADAAQAVPQPQPKGMMGHALEVLSLHPRLFEFVFAKAEKHELLSKVIYHAHFLDKDKAYEIKKNAEQDQAASDLRFLETFGADSDSDDV
ncbi:hypothetical protein DVH05_006515 [Phytophthora capsici]|nr:hypothetical protein DVH05_006515 [Phytophthora capsici]|eukprot:jgi/Phyca11/21974/fgenesh1_pg.PHYCAscaffold_312_\